MAYCAVENLLTGDIPVEDLKLQQYITDAADEMDSYLGSRYVTPITLVVSEDEAKPLQRVSRLVLKRINAQLASGRLITAQATGGEDEQVHAYGMMLLAQSIEALKSLATGNILLDGATPLPVGGAGSIGGTPATAPLVVNGDPYSQVDAFYDIVTPGRFIAAPYGVPPQFYPNYRG